MHRSVTALFGLSRPFSPSRARRDNRSTPTTGHTEAEKSTSRNRDRTPDNRRARATESHEIPANPTKCRGVEKRAMPKAARGCGKLVSFVGGRASCRWFVEPPGCQHAAAARLQHAQNRSGVFDAGEFGGGDDGLKLVGGDGGDAAGDRADGDAAD